jgi:tetratricopeptide (TPR) repeat protein
MADQSTIPFIELKTFQPASLSSGENGFPLVDHSAMFSQRSLTQDTNGGLHPRRRKLKGHAQHLGLFVLAALLLASLGRAQDPPAGFDDLARQAAAARDQQNIPLATELYGKALELNPNWAEGWWNLGLIEYTASEYPQAIDAFNHLLKLDPHAVPALAIRGLSEFDTGDYTGSLKDLELACQHGAANDKDHEQILRYHLGMLLTRAGRYWDALSQYRTLTGEHFDSPDFEVAVGLVGMRIPSLPSELSAHDSELAGALGKAACAFLADDSDTADAEFNDLFARYPTAPNLHYFYGFLLFPHDRDMAVEQFQKEVAIDPSNQLATGLLAFTLMYVGRYKDALPVAQRALAAEPGMQIAQIALGRSLIETGNGPHGIEILNHVLEHDPKNLEAHMGLAAAYSLDGRREDASRERMVCLGLGK